jgi:hypothetical protein
MVENSSSAPIPEADAEFGEVVVRCRRLTGRKWAKAQGFWLAGLFYYFLLPFFMLPYLAAMTAMVLFLICGYEIEEMNPWGLAVLFVFFYGLFFWFAILLPRNDYLVLYEKGIRARLGLKRWSIPFDSIAGLFVGQAVGPTEEALRSGLSLFKSGPMRMVQIAEKATVTFHTKDGKQHKLKALLTRFESQDLENWFQQLAERAPQLFNQEGSADSGSIAASPPGKSSLLPVLIITGLIVTIIVIFAVKSPAGKKSKPGDVSIWNETFVVQSPRPEVHPIPVRKGNSLYLRIQVVEGSRISVRICRDVVTENKSIIFKGTALPEGLNVTEYNLDWETWDYEKPALVVIVSEGKSQVRGEAKLRVPQDRERKP